MRRLKVGVTGVGFIGELHARIFNETHTPVLCPGAVAQARCENELANIRQVACLLERFLRFSATVRKSDHGLR